MQWNGIDIPEAYWQALQVGADEGLRDADVDTPEARFARGLIRATVSSQPSMTSSGACASVRNRPRNSVSCMIAAARMSRKRYASPSPQPVPMTAMPKPAV